MTKPKNNPTGKKSTKKCAKSKKQSKTNAPDGDKQSTAMGAVEGVKGFLPGTSGNPTGRPVGSRNKVTLAIESMLDGEWDAITRKCIDLAKVGDLTAIRMIMDRIAPQRKSRPISLDLPDSKSASDVLKAYDAIYKAIAHGTLSPDELGQVVNLLESTLKTIETVEIAERLTKIEDYLGIGE